MTRVPGNACITVLVCLSPSDSAMLVRNTLWEKKQNKQSSTFFSGFPSERVCGDSLALSKPAHWIQNNTAKEEKYASSPLNISSCGLFGMVHFYDFSCLSSTLNWGTGWLMFTNTHFGIWSRCGLFIIPSHKHHHVCLNIIWHAWMCHKITSHQCKYWSNPLWILVPNLVSPPSYCIPNFKPI